MRAVIERPASPDLDPHALLAQAPMPLLVLAGPDLRLALANEELRRVVGYRGPLGVPAEHVLPPAAVAQATEVLASGRPGRLGETAVTIGGGLGAGDRRYRATLQPVRDREGAVIAVMVAFEDVTEDASIRQAQHQACIEVERASARKERFITFAAHELRAPLMTLLLWEGLLRDGALEPADRARALDAIKDSAAVLSRLIGDLQDLTRALDGTLQLDVAPVELDELLHAGLARFAPVALARQLVVDAELSPGLGTLAGSSARLRQVLETLLDRAAARTPPGGTIAVRARREGAQLVVVISDTGEGLPRELVPFVFEPFSRLDDELARTDEGRLGLGLAIARELVRLHGGTLIAASAGRDAGTTFTLTLPQHTVAPDADRARDELVRDPSR